MCNLQPNRAVSLVLAAGTFDIVLQGLYVCLTDHSASSSYVQTPRMARVNHKAPSCMTHLQITLWVLLQINKPQCSREINQSGKVTMCNVGI